MERLDGIDFFSTPGGSTARSAYERAVSAVVAALPRPARPKSTGTRGNALDLAAYQGRRWITRPDVHIDRLASAWLIKQFIDKRPRFSFIPDGGTHPGGVRFDMAEAEFTHEGEDCTFETMIRRFGLGGDAGLSAIAEIVHDIDLKDGKFNRLEAAGLEAIVSGLSKQFSDDRERIQGCSRVFDGLYAGFAKAKGGTARGRTRSSAGARRNNRAAKRS